MIELPAIQRQFRSYALVENIVKFLISHRNFGVGVAAVAFISVIRIDYITRLQFRCKL